MISVMKKKIRQIVMSVNSKMMYLTFFRWFHIVFAVIICIYPVFANLMFFFQLLLITNDQCFLFQ